MRTLLFSALIAGVASCTLPLQAHAASGDFFAKAIQALMPDVPEMVEVARCESGLRQYTESGSVLRGGYGNQMIGLFQFHEKYHRNAALAAGYNIDTPLGNIGYARVLYRSEGLTPWRSSAHCWQSAQVASTPHTITTPLAYGMSGSMVDVLQRVLMAQGFLGSTFTAGRFDLATLKALIAFQCKEHIACHTGSVGLAGLGRVSGATLERINALIDTNTM